MVEVIEGRARLRLPEAERAERGPESKETAAVFYNPAMALNRDLSSLLLSTRARDGWQILDGLAASGARGLRYALEAGVDVQVEWNDWNPLAVRLIEENAHLNGVEPHVTCRNLQPLLYESVWAAVDIDPFGSPTPFLDGATRAVRDHGMLGLTATDTTALAGVFPKVCERRYLARPLHGELGHEVALRILAGAATRQAARYDVAFTPLLSHATDHYYRVTLHCRRGAGRADEALRHIGFAFLCRSCGARGIGEERRCPECGAKTDLAGPLWTGPLVDPAAAQAMLAKADAFPFAHPESRPLLERLAAEAGAPPLYYDIHAAGSRARLGSPRSDRVLDLLRERGFGAWPVHFHRLAVRTRATAKEFEAVVRDAMP